ncbi:MAG: amidohydrolase [Synergistaceae bacterium]|jgi:amidohydrolase|nr:amidohydrolase [Synergistaceae bacterium]
MKKEIFGYIDQIAPKLCEMADYIFDNPELGFEERKASKLLTDYLAEAGFSVDLGLGSLSTAFRAVYENGKGGPAIGLLCEYDALPGLGHGCAHHVQGPAIVGAAESLIKNVGDLPYKLIVYGTPAEEGGGGKIKMLAEGRLMDMDVALMTHGGPATQTDVKSMALSTVKAVFRGRSAHAALKPEEGRSALDGLLLACHGIEFLREHVRDDTRMHYAILDAGGPANVVPAVAEGEFVIRSYSSAYLDELLARLRDVLKGAAIMSGTTVETTMEKRLESKLPAYKLNEILMLNAELVNAPNRKPAREKTGSTDFGNVTCAIPGAVIRVAFVPDGTPSHSTEFVSAGKGREAHDAVALAAKILAGASFDMMENPELVKDIKREFAEAKAAV